MKAFNTKKINEIIQKYQFLQKEDFPSKKCFKKIKILEDIIYANLLFQWMSINKKEELVPMAEKFFS